MFRTEMPTLVLIFLYVLRKQPYMQCQRAPNSNTAYLMGCLDKGVEHVTDQAAILGGVGVGIAFVMVNNLKYDTYA